MAEIQDDDDNFDLKMLEDQEGGRLYTWGCGLGGRLGDGITTESIPVPMNLPGKIFDSEKIKAIAAGRKHTALVTSSGKVFTWGAYDDSDDNFYSSVAIPRLDTHVTDEPVRGVCCGLGITAVWTASKILVCWVHTDNVFRVVPIYNIAISEILQVAAGFKHILALVKDTQGKTEVLSMGKNNYGQMGRDNGRVRFKMTHTETQFEVNPSLSGKQIIQIACGSWHSLALSATGELYSFGQNTYGTCLHPDFNSNEPEPRLVDIYTFTQEPFEVAYVAAGTNHSVAVSTTGQVLIAGKGIPGVGQVLDIPTKIVRASAGYHHVLMVSDTGKIWCWGENNYGQLGRHLPLFVSKPAQMADAGDKQCLIVSCGYFHCVALMTSIPAIYVADSTFAANISSMLTKPQLTDLTIYLKDESKTIKAHKVFVARGSPILNQMIETSKNDSIYLPTDQMDIAMVVLKYLYSAKIKFPVSQAKEVCALATFLEIDALSTAINSSESTSEFIVIEPSVKSLDIHSSWADITLLSEGKSIRAHKVILSSRCERFRASLTGGMMESREDTFPVTDVSNSSLNALLEYIYTDQVTLNHEHVVDTMIAANMYVLPRMVNICEDWIKKNSSVDTICQLWMVAEKYGAKQLGEFCKFFMQAKFAQVAKTKGFQELPLQQWLKENEHLLHKDPPPS